MGQLLQRSSGPPVSLRKARFGVWAAPVSLDTTIGWSRWPRFVCMVYGVIRSTSSDIDALATRCLHMMREIWQDCRNESRGKWYHDFLYECKEAGDPFERD